MATFEITTPDGRVFEVVGKDAQGAAAAVKKMLSSQPQQGGQQQPQPQQDDRSLPRAIADIGGNVVAGVPKAFGALVGAGSQIPLVNKVTDPVAESLTAVGNYAEHYLVSDVQKQKNKVVAAAIDRAVADLGEVKNRDDIVAYVIAEGGAAADAIMEDPSQIPMLTAQALPYMFAGGWAGKALKNAGLVKNAVTAAAIGEGTVAMGAVTNDIVARLKAKGIEGYTSDRLAALPAGVLTALIGRLGGKVNTKLGSTDVDTAIVEGLNKGTLKGISPKGAAISATTETGEEFLQSAQEQAFTNVGAGDPAYEGVGSSAVQGAAAGFGMGSVIGSNVMNAGSRDLTEEQMEQRAVAADVARNIRKVADNNGYSLDDVNPTSGNGARQALEEVRNQQVRDVVNLAKKLKKQLDPRQAETLEQLLMDYSAAEAAIAAGKRKVSTKVTTDQYDAVKRLVTPYKEGNALLQTLLGTNVVTDLFKDGMKGGLSQWTDLFNPLLTSGHSYDPTRVGNVVLGGLPLMTYGIDSVIPQAAIVLGGQAIDKVLGGKGGTRRKLVKRFVNLNEGNDGLGSPTGPSLIAQAQQAERQEEQEAEAARIRKQQNTDAFNQMDGIEFNKSPLGILYLGTGLNQAGLEALLAHIEQHYSDKPAVSRWTDETRRNLAGEENQIEDINKWVGALNGVLNTDARLDALREDQPDNPLAQRARRRAGFGPSASQSSAGTAQQQQPQGRSPAVQSGIDANNALADRLLNGMESDQSIPDTQKKLLRTALLEFGARTPDGRRGNIGANGQPLQNALDIVERLRASGVMPRYINDYIMPYVQRVAQQNAGRSAREQQQQQPPSTGTDLAFDEDFDASKPALTDNVPTGAVSGVPMETYLPRAYDIAKREVYKKGRDLKLALQKRSLQAQRSNKINLREMTPVNEDRLADFAVADALEALKTNSNAIGWYNKTVSEALSQMAQVFPEIATDPKAKLQFVWALAATSNGTKVDKNLELAGIAYEHLQKTGRFPTDIGIGKAAKAIRSGLQMYHTMLDKFNGDHAALEQFSNSQFTVKDLEERYGIPISGEGANETVRGAAVLGPKIGNGFFSNLYGNFDALTIDRWNMRTVGRWRGDLVVINKKMIKKKRDELWSILSSMSDEDMRSLRKLYKGTRTKLSNTVMSDRAIDKWANATAKLSQDPDWRNLINDLGFEEVRKKGNGLFGYLDGQREAPSGPTERAFIRRVFEKALDRLNNEPTVLALPSSNRSNQPLNMSDLQALLWYPEKLLYDTAKKPVGEESKGYKDDEAPDYANAARKFVNNRQANSKRGRLGLTNGTRGRGRGASTPNDGPNGQPTSFDQEPAGILRSEQANDRGRGRSRRDAGGQLTPLEDAPVLRGHKGPIQNLVKVVEKYAAENNIPYVAQGEFVNVDPAFGARVAEAYDQMKDQPNDPAVKAAYADMIRQTKAQYDALVQDGYTFFFIDPASGYGDSPVTALEDLRLNKRMGIFPTDEGYGSDENATFDDNPLLEKSGETWANEDGSPKDVLYNDLFRAVHDAFGHGLEGSGFRARGEENAFQAHIRLFVGPARGAMTSETRGQNSYLNYGPHGENNQTASVEDTKFADQKIGVMPSWTWSENIAPDEMIEQSFDQDLAGQSAGALTQQPQQQSPFNMKSLVNKMLGRQPPTPEQVKAQLPEVRALFEIGKKGSKYEKGIQNLDDALVLADALGLTVRMFDVQQDMMNAVGVGDRVRGVFRSSTKEVFGLKAGTPSDALGTITDLEALTTILHEIGHGMAAGVGPTEQSTLLQMDNDMNSDATAYVNAANPSSQQRSNIETALSGSFEAAMFPHLAIDYTGRGSKIQQEVINLQENIEVYLDKNISETRKVRKILQLRDQAAKDGSGLARLQFVNHLQYVRGNREFSVDPLWVYMANPKLARAVMPMTTALIKKHFKDAQSTDIQFFAHPLAVSLAVVLAMMLNGRTEEEEEEQMRQQMPAGALSPQAGALSQQQFAA